MPKLFVSNRDESLRLFKSDLLETFTRVHPVVPLVLYVPVIGYMSYEAYRSESINGGSFLMLVAAGVLAWTLTEYVMHRFFFHFPPRTPWQKRLAWTIHGVHHDYPNDSRRLVIPPIISIPLAVLFFLLFFALLGNEMVYPFFAGFVVGYLIYDMTHYATHHFAMRSAIGRRLKKHHMTHHYRDNERAFGVSSPLWDYIFRTMPAKKK